MKKIIIMVCFVFLFSFFSIIFYADEDSSYITEVEFLAPESESYQIVVPAKLSPGSSGKIVVEGKWPGNRTIMVTADDKVDLTNKVDVVTAKVEFDAIIKEGSDSTSQFVETHISLESLSDTIMFGKWSGIFTYSVEIVDRESMYLYKNHKIQQLPIYGDNTEYKLLSYLPLDDYQLEGESIYNYIECDKPFIKKSDNKIGIYTAGEGLVCYSGYYVSSSKAIPFVNQIESGINQVEKWSFGFEKVWGVDQEVYLDFISNYDAEIIWTNYDILNEDGSIYFEKSPEAAFVGYR